MRNQWLAVFALVVSALVAGCGESPTDVVNQTIVIIDIDGDGDGDVTVRSLTVTLEPRGCGAYQIVTRSGETEIPSSYLEYDVDGVGSVSSTGLWTNIPNGPQRRVTVSLRGKPDIYKSAYVDVDCDDENPQRVLTSIDFVPDGGTYQVGWSEQAVATCRDQYRDVMPCPTLTWVSSQASIVHVTPDGLISCRNVGTAEIGVRTPNGGPAEEYAFRCKDDDADDDDNTSSVLSVEVTPSSQACYPGEDVVSNARVTVIGNASKNVRWSISNQNILEWVSETEEFLVGRCKGFGTAIVTAESEEDPSKRDTGTVLVEQPEYQACSVTHISYTASSYTIAVGEHRMGQLDQTENWPSNCQVIYYTPNPGTLQVTGADVVFQINGIWFYAGKRFRVTGVNPGSTQVYARLITINPDGEWVATDVIAVRTWTVTSGSSGNVMAVVTEIPKLRYENLDWVSQTFDEKLIPIVTELEFPELRGVDRDTLPIKYK